MALVESKKLIARRVPPGDNWSLVNDNQKVYASITETLEAYVRQTRERCDFHLSPLKGELFAVVQNEIIPEVKKWDIYGEEY